MKAGHALLILLSVLPLLLAEEDVNQAAFDWVGMVCIMAFYVVILGVGIWASRKQVGQSPEEMLLAGRNLGGFVGVMTLLSTWYCAGTIYSNVEMILTNGLLNTQTIGCYSVCFIIGAIFFVKKIRSGNYLTMLDPFQRKFGPRMTALLYLPEVLADVLWIGTTFAALGSCLSSLIGIPPWVGIAVSAIFSSFYTFTGGMYAVAYTDVLQFLVLFVCLWACVPVVWTSEYVTNPFDDTSKWLGHIDTSTIGAYIDDCLMLIFGSIPVQVYIQRILSVRTVRDAQMISVLCGVGNLICDTATALLSIMGASAMWEKTPLKTIVGHEAYGLTYIYRYLVPHAVSYIGLGALSAATLSTADSLLLASSGMFTMNIYQPFFRPKASPRELTWATKIAVIVVTALGIVLALTASSMYYLFILTSDVVYIILFPQLMLILWYPNADIYGAFISYFVGLILRFGAGVEYFKIPPFLNYPEGFPHKTMTVIISMVLEVAVSEFCRYMIVVRGYRRLDIVHYYFPHDAASDDAVEVMSALNDAVASSNEKDEKKDKKKEAGGTVAVGGGSGAVVTGTVGALGGGTVCSVPPVPGLSLDAMSPASPTSPRTGTIGARDPGEEVVDL